MKIPTIIIAITGTIGAGKGAIVAFLRQLGFKHYSVRGFLEQELIKRGLEINRDNMRELGNELRAKNGGAYILKELLAQARAAGGDAVIESLRTPTEVDPLNEETDVTLLAVDAPIELRYQRILERGSETDHVTFEEFVQQEQKEMQNDDPAKQNLKYCIEKTPLKQRIWNEGSFEELELTLQSLLASARQQQTVQ